MEIQPQLPLVGEIRPRARGWAPGADDWRLDEPTRTVGRRGLAAARAALARTAPDPGVRADAA